MSGSKTGERNDLAVDALVREQMSILMRGTAEIISQEDLASKLTKSRRTGIPLKIKLGIDPTAPHVHLGFAVVLRKLRAFQEMGHRVQLIIGDFTARVGDPSGRSETRKMLSPEEIAENAKTYREQLSIILDPSKTDVTFNSEWLGPLDFADILSLTSKYTVARILERDDFSNRYKNGIPLGMHEILYPLMQGYDSVALKSDVEMGGTDQKFNILVGRDLQREYGIEPQVVFLMPILEGLDGKLKMSKSYGNYVGITEPPNEMFGKIMSIPDELIGRYFELCTDLPMDEVNGLAVQMKEGKLNPRDVKMRLGEEIVAIYHNRTAGKEAKEEFLRVFSMREVPADIPEYFPSLRTINLDDVSDFFDSLNESDLIALGIEPIQVSGMLIDSGIVSSKREAIRRIEQGAVSIDGEKITDKNKEIVPKDGMVLRGGKRDFRRIRLNKGS